MLALAEVLTAVWSHSKVQFAIVAPVAAAALLITTAFQLAAPKVSNPVGLALVLSGSAVVLVVWAKAVALPLVTKGKLPDGRSLGDVLARRRPHDDGQSTDD